MFCFGVAVDWVGWSSLKKGVDLHLRICLRTFLVLMACLDLINLLGIDIIRWIDYEDEFQWF